MESRAPSPTNPPLAGGPQTHPAAWARTQQQWARGAALPWLHQEVARRMADRLSVIRAQPAVVLEWDALAGQSRAVLQAAYPHARWEPVGTLAASPVVPPVPSWGPAPGNGDLPAAGPRAWRERIQRWWRPAAQPPNSATAGPDASPAKPNTARSGATATWQPSAIPANHAQLLWSNLGLHTHAEPDQVLRRWHAALAVDGFLMFSTFGPDTLREWRALWAEMGWGPPAQDFRDMHDWGDDLVAAGFADPVMDQETITLTWASAEAALAELRTLGRNAHPGRHAGCRTPGWRGRLLRALGERAGPDGRIALTFEVVYGHAFRPAPRPRVEPVTAVSLDEMRHLVQTSRRPL